MSNCPAALAGREAEVQAGERRDDGSFCAKDELAEGGLLESAGTRGGEFVVRPAAFGADGEGRRGRIGVRCVDYSPQSLTDGWCVAALREQQANFRGLSGKGLGGLNWVIEKRDPQAAGLLRGFKKDFLPALRPLRCGGKQAFFRARGGQRNDSADAKLRGFFESPFECVKLDDGEQQRGFDAGLRRLELLYQSKLNAITLDCFDASQPCASPVAQFIELARLCAENVTQVMRRVAFDNRGVSVELLDKESAAHAWILS